MIHLLHILLIVWLHYIADFVCQTDYMARGKSKSNLPLVLHISVYSLVMFLGTLYIFGFFWSLIFAVANGVTHYYVDYVTSRVSSKKYAEGKLGSTTIPNFGFFSIIGLDQAIHYTCLFLIYYWINLNIVMG